MNYLVSALISVAVVVGGWFIAPEPHVDVWDNLPFSFGASSFPTSIDSFTNPGATDSVATVSHSGQHTNANEAIRLIESKLGTGASTSSAGTLLAGDGTGTSVWTTFATTTNLQATNLVALGSTTLQNFTGSNATTSQATTTNLHVSGFASTTQFRANTSEVGSSTIQTLNSSTGYVSSLTVDTCAGCVTSDLSLYAATTTGSAYKAKTLNLVSGDLVVWGLTHTGSSDCGALRYRVTSPSAGASTTVMADASLDADDPCTMTFAYLATTTQTVVFEFVNNTTATNWLWLQPSAYGNQF